MWQFDNDPRQSSVRMRQSSLKQVQKQPAMKMEMIMESANGNEGETVFFPVKKNLR